MGFWASLRQLNQRALTPEIMDDPALDETEHLRALNGLERINRFSFSARHVWAKIEPAIRENPSRSLRVLDIATGGGDIPISLFKMASKYGAKLTLEACDISPRALEFARKRAEATKADVRFFVHDAVQNSVPDGYDIIISSLFFHHLQTEQAAKLLNGMGRMTRHSLVVNDLERGRWAWLLANAATRLLSSSHVVHVDGPLSVKAAFNLLEIRQMARDAGLDGCVLERRFPCRFLLSWNKMEPKQQ